MRVDSLGAAWAVGDLVGAIGQAVAQTFNPVRVKGEISGFTRAVSGHCYFSLKDARGQIRCAMFKRAAAGLSRFPKEGDQVEVTGRLDVYAPRGDLQLVVETLETAGQGDLYEQFLRVKAKLQGMGLFDSSRKRALPRYPRHIGVVTSLGAAALHDVVSVFARRTPHIRVTVFPSAVQGSNAPRELVQALQRASVLQRDGMSCDLILLVRGGGSLEDLWAFNDEGLAVAIANSTLPVLSGVGHETDFTIADFVADLRAPTPTAAAELVSEDTTALNAALADHASALADGVQWVLDRESQRCDRLTSRLVRPSQRLAQQQRRLTQAGHALSNALRGHLTRAGFGFQQARLAWLASAGVGLKTKRESLERLALRWQGTSPKAALDRGYAWVQGPDGQAVHTVGSVSRGDHLRLVMRDGELGATVDAVEPD